MAFTPFPALDAILDELVTRARQILGANFLGAYLQGSFAVGDADEHSDVDFLIVTQDELTEAQDASLYRTPTNTQEPMTAIGIVRCGVFDSSA